MVSQMVVFLFLDEFRSTVRPLSSFFDLNDPSLRNLAHSSSFFLPSFRLSDSTSSMARSASHPRLQLSNKRVRSLPPFARSPSSSVGHEFQQPHLLLSSLRGCSDPRIVWFGSWREGLGVLASSTKRREGESSRRVVFLFFALSFRLFFSHHNHIILTYFLSSLSLRKHTFPYLLPSSLLHPGRSIPDLLSFPTAHLLSPPSPSSSSTTMSRAMEDIQKMLTFQSNHPDFGSDIIARVIPISSTTDEGGLGGTVVVELEVKEGSYLSLLLSRLQSS